MSQNPICVIPEKYDRFVRWPGQPGVALGDSPPWTGASGLNRRLEKKLAVSTVRKVTSQNTGPQIRPVLMVGQGGGQR